MGRPASPGRPECLDSAAGRRDRSRGNQGPGRPRASQAGEQDGTSARCPSALESTRATVDLDLEHRRKGLLWYATYTVTFKGTYTFRNPDAEARELHVRLPLPAEDALFDDFVFAVDGRTAVPAGDVSKEMTAIVNAAPGAVDHPGRPVPIARARHVDLRLCRDRRRAGARLQPGAADEFPGHRLPRRDRLAERDDGDAERLDADAGRSRT